MKEHKGIVVLLSGGIDSATCLAEAAQKTERVIALNMFYGQKHDKEIECARWLADYYKAEYIELDISNLMQYSDCSLLKHSTKEIEHGSYHEELPDTYVPFRNGLLLSIAASIALSKDCDVVMYGAHKDDVIGSAYPDCSPSFYRDMGAAIYGGTARQVQVSAPYIQCNKAEVVKRGLELNVPYEHTWSCYEGGDKPCGKCATCIDREKAFEQNGVKDPYEQD